MLQSQFNALTVEEQQAYLASGQPITPDPVAPTATTTPVAPVVPTAASQPTGSLLSRLQADANVRSSETVDGTLIAVANFYSNDDERQSGNTDRCMVTVDINGVRLPRICFKSVFPHGLMPSVGISGVPCKVTLMESREFTTQSGTSATAVNIVGISYDDSKLSATQVALMLGKSVSFQM